MADTEKIELLEKSIKNLEKKEKYTTNNTEKRYLRSQMGNLRKELNILKTE